MQGERRIPRKYLKYTVKYIDWDASIVPVNIYLLDITDTWKKPEKSNATVARHHCKVCVVAILLLSSVRLVLFLV